MSIIHFVFLLAIFFIKFPQFPSTSHQRSDDFIFVRKISTGFVRGQSIRVGSNGERAFIFLGIPYAKQPKGEFRFRPTSEEATSWTGTLNATEYGPSCLYNSLFTSADTTPVPMSENCLLVNIFTSEKCLRKGGCPVFQYIYGGQFMFGTARKLDPQIIAENFNSPGRDIVVVTFGYRMNVFGLLNLNYFFYELNPPNTVLHDILAAIRWSRKEIVNFGGDPNRITLGGESSGSVAAQILSVCPRANSLFQQVISMSGPGTIEMLPKNRNQRSSRKLTFLMNCINEKEWKSSDFWAHPSNISAVMKCMEKVPAQNILAALPSMEKENLYFHGLAKEIAPNGIVTDTFQNLLIKNPPKMPLLTGTVSKEFQDTLFAVIDPKSGQIDPVRLWLYCRRLVRQLNYENMKAALAECFEEYSDDERVKFLFEDINYFVPHYNFAAGTANQGVPTFLYQFEYEWIGKAYGHPPNRFGSPREWTPKHVQDLVYLFGQNKGIFSAKDRHLQRLHSALFANFIANGTPNGAEIWNARQFKPALFNYYRIDFADQQNWTELAGNTPGGYHKRAVEFWNIKMAKAGGKVNWLSDEALIDDQMLSEFIEGDVAKMRELNVPWQQLKGQKKFWQHLFLISTFACLIGFALFCAILLVFICERRRRQRQFGYTQINGTAI